jgi:hypothetical protein
MKEYQAAKPGSAISAISLSEKHTWAEVLDAARAVETAYQEAGIKGFRKYGRAVSAKAETVLPVLHLIPNENYCSILSGGLKLVFEERFIPPGQAFGR